MSLSKLTAYIKAYHQATGSYPTKVYGAFTDFKQAYIDICGMGSIPSVSPNTGTFWFACNGTDVYEDAGYYDGFYDVPSHSLTKRNPQPHNQVPPPPSTPVPTIIPAGNRPSSPAAKAVWDAAVAWERKYGYTPLIAANDAFYSELITEVGASVAHYQSGIIAGGYKCKLNSNLACDYVLADPNGMVAPIYYRFAYPIKLPVGTVINSNNLAKRPGLVQNYIPQILGDWNGGMSDPGVFTDAKSKACECGSTAVGSSNHSNWCPVK